MLSKKDIRFWRRTKSGSWPTSLPDQTPFPQTSTSSQEERPALQRYQTSPLPQTSMTESALPKRPQIATLKSLRLNPKPPASSRSVFLTLASSSEDKSPKRIPLQLAPAPLLRAQNQQLMLSPCLPLYVISRLVLVSGYNRRARLIRGRWPSLPQAVRLQ